MGTFSNKARRFDGEITSKVIFFFLMYNKLAILIARKRGENKEKEVEKLLKLEDYKITKIEERSEKKEMKKIIYLESKNKKQKCPVSGEFTNSIHDKLKPIELKYLKIGEYNSKINIVKKRFICHKCNKKFTENINLNSKHKNISTKLEQKILKVLMLR